MVKKNKLPLLFKKSLIILLFSNLISLNICEEYSKHKKKISTVNSFLPICDEKLNCNRVYELVSAYGGCFDWFAKNETLLTVEKIHKENEKTNCFSSVYISPKLKIEHEFTYLIAKDKNSNENNLENSFKCQVTFGKISEISIEKNFDYMLVDNIYEIYVQAKDHKKNLFTSLEGFKFKWTINKGKEIGELIKPSNNGNKKIGIKREIVEKDSFSDIVLIKGLQTGKIEVSVKIMENLQNSEQLFSNKTIYVVEPFKIVPRGPVYILTKTKFKFNLFYKNSGLIVKENDYSYFQWTIENEKCGKFVDYGIFLSNENECYTNISVIDTRLDDYNVQTTEIYVVNPKSIDTGFQIIDDDLLNINLVDLVEKVRNDKFKIFPKFKFIENKNYLLKNILFYDDNIIHFNKNEIIFNFEISEILKEFLEIDDKKCINNKEYCLIKTKKTSNEYYNLKINTKINEIDLETTKKIKIYSKIHVENFGLDYFTLPFLGNFKEKIGQELHLIIEGGSSKYKFKSSDYNVIDIINDNYLIGLKQGFSTITVFDQEIEENIDKIDVYVKPVNNMIYFEEKQEVKINNNFFMLPIAVQNDNNTLINKYDVRNIFTNCSSLETNYFTLYENFIEKLDLESSKYSDISQHKIIINYIKNNNDLINSKIQLLKLDTSNSNILKYLNYSNFGICDIQYFKAIKEGLIKMKFSGKNLNLEGSTIKEGKVMIYQDMKIYPTIFDNFTKVVLQNGEVSNPDETNEYIIGETGGMNLRFKGGIEPWKDKNIKFNIKTFVLDENKNLKSADNYRKKIHLSFLYNKEVYLYCLSKDNEIIFEIFYYNSKDESLLRPANCSISFTIGCYKPESLSIFLLGQYNNYQNVQNIFEIPQKPGTQYYVKKNSTDIIRVYAFDSHKRLFSNITSFSGKFYQVPNSYEIINPVNYDKYDIKNIITDNSFEYIQEILYFHNIYSKFNLVYQLKSRILEHYCTINIIDLPEIEPKNATLYVNENNYLDLNILRGSGNFEVFLSDSSLATFMYDSNLKKIRLFPKKSGIVFVNVRDLELGKNNNYIVTTTVFLSDTKQIILFGGGLVMENNTIQISIEIYDSFDNLYPLDQLKQIKLGIIQDSNGIDVNLINNHYLNVTGYESGVYEILVFDYKNNVTSNAHRIEVFKKLEIFPPYLLLFPGSSYTLSVTGGPDKKENVLFNYEMQNDKIASVLSNSYPQVLGKTIGETFLKITLSYKFDYNKIYNTKDDEKFINKTETLFVKNVSVKVHFPERAEIIGGGNNRIIFKKSSIRLLTALKKDEEVFTYGIGPVSFNWKVDNSLLAKIIYYDKKNYNDDDNENKNNNNFEIDDMFNGYYLIDEDKHPENSIGIFLNLLEIGIVKIKLTVNINYPDPYKKRNPNIFTVEETINIKEKTYFTIPDHLQPLKNSLYMIPFNVDHELHTNKNIQQKYQIIKQFSKEDSNNNAKIISLSEGGRVTSYFTEGLAYVIVTPIDSKTNIPVNLVIFVSDFYSIYAGNTNSILDVMIGQEITLKVIIQHENGQFFAEAFDRLKLRAVVSHPNVANCELSEFGSRIKIKALTKGSTNVILFAPESRKIYDVFRINVGESETLLDKIYLNVGGSVELFGKNIEKKKKIFKNAELITDDNEIISIDKYGIFTGKKEGNANVYLKTLDNKIKLKLVIIVKRIKNIAMDRSFLPSTLTDIKNSKDFKSEYQIPIILYTNNNEPFTNGNKETFHNINQNFDFKCNSNKPEFLLAYSEKKDNYYECIIKIRDYDYSKKKISEKPKNIKINLLINTFVPNSNKILYSVNNEEILPFSSSFKIKNNLHIINFTNKKRNVDVYIDNLSDLEYNFSDKKKIKIDEINKDLGYVKFTVPNEIEDEFINVKIIITNTMTSQKEEIICNFTIAERNILDTFSDILATILLIIIVALLSLFIYNNSGRKNISNLPNNYYNNNFLNNNFNQRRNFPNFNNNNVSPFNQTSNTRNAPAGRYFGGYRNFNN